MSEAGELVAEALPVEEVGRAVAVGGEIMLSNGVVMGLSYPYERKKVT